LDEITEAVKKAKSSVENLDDKPPYHQYVVGAFNTAFRYELADDTGVNVAQTGLVDLDACLPYTLVFVSEIETVELPARRYSLRERHALLTDGEVQMVSMAVENPQEKNQSASHSLAVLTSGLTTIAIPVERVGEKIRIIRPSHEVPRLFCDFPLLGTEDFPFPVIINNRISTRLMLATACSSPTHLGLILKSTKIRASSGRRFHCISLYSNVLRTTLGKIYISSRRCIPFPPTSSGSTHRGTKPKFLRPFETPCSA
jgi:hypothetical protein